VIIVGSFKTEYDYICPRQHQQILVSLDMTVTTVTVMTDNHIV